MFNNPPLFFAGAPENAGARGKEKRNKKTPDVKTKQGRTPQTNKHKKMQREKQVRRKELFFTHPPNPIIEIHSKPSLQDPFVS